MYGGKTSQILHRQCLLTLIQRGFNVKLWNVGFPTKGPRWQTKRGHAHELMFYTQLLETVIPNDDEEFILSANQKAFLEYRAEIEEKLDTLDEFLIDFETMSKLQKQSRIDLTDDEIVTLMRKIGITLKAQLSASEKKAAASAFKDKMNDRVFFNTAFYRAAKVVPFNELDANIKSKKLRSSELAATYDLGGDWTMDEG